MQNHQVPPTNSRTLAGNPVSTSTATATRPPPVQTALKPSAGIRPSPLNNLFRKSSSPAVVAPVSVVSASPPHAQPPTATSLPGPVAANTKEKVVVNDSVEEDSNTFLEKPKENNSSTMPSQKENENNNELGGSGVVEVEDHSSEDDNTSSSDDDDDDSDSPSSSNNPPHDEEEPAIVREKEVLKKKEDDAQEDKTHETTKKKSRSKARPKWQPTPMSKEAFRAFSASSKKEYEGSAEMFASFLDVHPEYNSKIPLRLPGRGNMVIDKKFIRINTAMGGYIKGYVVDIEHLIPLMPGQVEREPNAVYYLECREFYTAIRDRVPDSGSWLRPSSGNHVKTLFESKIAGQSAKRSDSVLKPWHFLISPKDAMKGGVSIQSSLMFSSVMCDAILAELGCPDPVSFSTKILLLGDSPMEITTPTTTTTPVNPVLMPPSTRTVKNPDQVSSARARSTSVASIPTLASELYTNEKRKHADVVVSNNDKEEEVAGKKHKKHKNGKKKEKKSKQAAEKDEPVAPITATAPTIPPPVAVVQPPPPPPPPTMTMNMRAEKGEEGILFLKDYIEALYENMAELRRMSEQNKDTDQTILSLMQEIEQLKREAETSKQEIERLESELVSQEAITKALLNHYKTLEKQVPSSTTISKNINGTKKTD